MKSQLAVLDIVCSSPQSHPISFALSLSLSLSLENRIFGEFFWRINPNKSTNGSGRAD